MVVEVILSEIREDRCINANAMDAALIKGMGRSFQGHCAAAFGPHLREERMHLQRLRRGVRCVTQLPTDVILNSSQEAAANMSLVHQMMH